MFISARSVFPVQYVMLHIRFKEAQKLGFNQAVAPGGSSELWKDKSFSLSETKALAELVAELAAKAAAEKNR